MRPCMHRHKNFFACDISVPVRVEHEGGTAAWLVGTLVVPSIKDTASATGVMALSGSFFFFFFFFELVAEDQKGLWPVFLHSSAFSGT